MRQIIISTIAASILGLTAIAASVPFTPQVQAGEKSSAALVQPTPMSKNTLGNRHPGELLGRTIVNAKGETVGRVDDIVISPDRMVYAVVAVGGFLGFGETEIAIPFDQLWSSGSDGTVLMMSETSADELKAKTPYQKRGYTSVPRDEPVRPR